MGNGLWKYGSVFFSIVAYSICSGLLLLMNKLTLFYFPSPGLVTLVQVTTAVVALSLLRLCGLIKFDEFTPHVLKSYSMYVVLFVLACFSNMMALSVHNVDTVIVGRSCCPLLVAYLDVQFLGRSWPTPRSALALGLVLLGTSLFAYFEYDSMKGKEGGVLGFIVLLVYIAVLSVEMAFGKKMTEATPVNLSTSVFLTNGLSALPMVAVSALKGELASQELLRVRQNWEAVDPDGTAGYLFLAVSSVLGLGIGYSGWWCRSETSATTYTLIGIMNKILTITLNVVVWEKHAGLMGTVALFLALGGGTLYRQAPLRNEGYDKVAKYEESLEQVEMQRPASPADPPVGRSTSATTAVDPPIRRSPRT